MRAAIQSLGWYIRCTPHVAELAPFYDNVLRLPRLRATPPSVAVYWAGEVSCYELLPGTSTPRPYARPPDAPAIPVFRTYHLDALVARLSAAGARVLGIDAEPFGRTAYIFDPVGHLNGFRETRPEARLPQEREAQRRWLMGKTALPGVAPMPGDIQDLGWVILNVDDLARETAFYRDVIGLDLVSRDAGRTVLSLGDTGLLELRPGGARLPVPAHRRDVTELVEWRVWNHPRVAADLKRHGVTFVHAPFPVRDGNGKETGGVAAHFVDPEGHLLAIQANAVRPGIWEEVEAHRRWRARRSPVGRLKHMLGV